MNERIQELALEAGKYADETQPRGSYTRDGMWLYAYNEKFAQLLIEECVTCVKYTDKDHIFTAHDASVVGAAHDRAMKAIRKHFGVEK